jgi:hypothetical protein
MKQSGFSENMQASVELALRKCPVGSPAVETRVRIGDLVIAGFTGRDQRAVEAHIAELEEIGVKRPATVPVFYRVAAANLTSEAHITVLGEASSGEVEFVLFKLEDGLWIGVGSDHTDRELEAKYTVAASKQVCAKPIARDLWRFTDINSHWDTLELRAWATIGGEHGLYQQGKVSDMMSPDALIAQHAAHFGDIAVGTAMFCGTFAVAGGPRPGSRFEFEIFDPILDRRISHAYAINTLPVRQ